MIDPRVPLRRRLTRRLLRRLVVVLTLLLFVGSVLELGMVAAAAPQNRSVDLLFFWGVGCPHCEEAKPFVRDLDAEPGVEVTWWEVKRDPEGRRKFIEKVRELRIDKPSVPTFVCGDGYVVGFTPGKTEPKVRQLLEDCRGEATGRYAALR